MDRAERRRLSKEENKLIAQGLVAGDESPARAIALARRAHSILEIAKRNGDIDPFVQLFYEKIDATVRSLRDIPIACKKGCSHCCNIWVSASAPELIYLSKIIKKRQALWADKVFSANELTKEYEFEVRDQHPFPCPLLANDRSCSIYYQRPHSCRLASSMDATICERSYNNISDEGIPTPALYLWGREDYAIVSASVLRASGMPFEAYELNAGLTAALLTENVESRWLGGENVFASVRRDPARVFSTPKATGFYERVFAH